MIKIDPAACSALKRTLQENNLPGSVRIEIRSSGCCDSILGIAAEPPGENDFVYKTNGLTMAVPPEIHTLVGGITISFVDDFDRKGFILTSEKPLNEWAGFTTCTIRL